MESIEQIIRRYVPLGKISNSGFYSLKCPICNDYKYRLGIKFEAGNVVTNCFNCAYKAVYEAGSKNISNKLRKLLILLGVEESEIEKFEGNHFLESKNNPVDKTITVESLSKKQFNTPVQPLPDGSVLLENSNDESALDIAEYLQRRKMLDTGYPFYVAEKRYPRRVIIPFYRNGKIIFWQGRTIDDVDPRYVGCDAPKEAIIFNYDALYRDYGKPLFVCEGVFDALSINGISLIGSTLNETKIDILKACRRPIIFVLDPDKNGKILGEKVLDCGWQITFTPEGSEDVNHSITKYGKLFTIYTLMKNARTDSFQTRTEIAIHCRNSKNK